MLFVNDLDASRDFYGRLLGLQVIHQDASSASFSAGPVAICLRLAANYGITLGGGRDRSVDITFLVDDLAKRRDELEARGLRFSRTLEYVIGSTVDFYDPDGRWFSLYQPSEAALGWPSGHVVRALRDTLRGTEGGGLAGMGLIYLFLFVDDPDAAFEFYDGVLGLQAIEGGPCRRIATSAPVGVVKYDVGGTLLATHHVEGDESSHRVTTSGSNRTAMVLTVDDVDAAAAELARDGVAIADWATIQGLGRLARLEDPAGRVFILRDGSSAPLPAQEVRG